ncbi:MAG: hypothetical protein U0350_08465 [Caldilineaceae bacterium]
MNANDPNYHILAHIIYEQRLAEALRRHRHWYPPENPLWQPSRWRTNLGERLINLGLRLKQQAEAATPTEQPILAE